MVDLVTNKNIHDPKIGGAWEFVGYSGVVGIHAALLHTGQVLFFARPENPSHKWGTKYNGLLGDESLPTCIFPNDASTGEDTNAICEPDVTLSAIVTTVGPNAFKPSVVQVEHNPFCSGHTFLPDGRLLVVGGDKKDAVGYRHRVPKGTKNGLKSVRVFIPSNMGPGEWKHIGELSNSRWYPTCSLLPDGRVFIVSGSLDDQQDYNNQNSTCENFPPMPSGPQYLPPLVLAWPYHSYPFVYVLPAGNLFLFAKDTAYYLSFERDACGNEKWVVKSGPKLPIKLGSNEEEPAKHYPNNATSVLLPLLPNSNAEKAYKAEVLIIGGGGRNVYPHWGFASIEACRECFKLNADPDDVNTAWQRIEPMSNPRIMPDAVLLPDGTVLVVNGVQNGFAGGDPGTGPATPQFAVKEAEIYNPITNKWDKLASAEFSRLYHSTALLLPDARVLIAGSDHQVNDRDFSNLPSNSKERRVRLAESYEYRLETFSPPYLFTDIPRPIIESVHESVFYGQNFNVRIQEQPEEEELTAAILFPGSVTHNNNMSQRYVGLEIIDRSTTQVTLKAPPDSNIAPPGYYMLFLIDRGVPSEAKFVQLLLKPDDKHTMFSDTTAMRFLPITAGLAIRLEADTGVFADSTGSVISWYDLSGQGNHVYYKPNRRPGTLKEAKSKLQKQPKLIRNKLNGHDVIRFETVSDWGVIWGGYLESEKAFLPGTGPYTTFIVAQPGPNGTNESGANGLMGWGCVSVPESNSAVTLRFEHGKRTGLVPNIPGEAFLVTNIGNREVGKSNRDQLQSPFMGFTLFETSFEGTRAEARLNAKFVEETEVTYKNTGFGPLTIGRSGRHIDPIHPEGPHRGDYYQGEIVEILIYDRLVLGEERQIIEKYLRDKYALSQSSFFE